MRLVKGDYCAAINCKNNRGTCPQKSFFRFPTDPERCNKWVVNCRRKDLLPKTSAYVSRNCKLCMDHFEDPMFLNDLRNRLQSTAIPTLFDVPNPPKRIYGRKKRKSLLKLRPPLLIPKIVQCSPDREEKIAFNSDITESEVCPRTSSPSELDQEIQICDNTDNFVVVQTEHPMIVYEKLSPESSIDFSNTLHDTIDTRKDVSTQTDESIGSSAKEEKLRERLKEKNNLIALLRVKIHGLEQRIAKKKQLTQNLSL